MEIDSLCVIRNPCSGPAIGVQVRTRVEAPGRITPHDLGIYQDAQIEPLRRINQFLHAQGAVSGVQLAHAGRKASTTRPWEGGKPLSPAQGGWSPLAAPSALPFDEGYAVPESLDQAGINAVVRAFGDATRRAVEAEFQVIEVHAAHGYLLHEFLSPLSNHRADAYGGSWDNRTRVVREVVAEIRRHWPERLPLFVRLSATDWAEGGWDLEQSVELARTLEPLGVDVIDCSSGGNVPHASIPVGAGYQTPLAARVKAETNLLTGAVGLITAPAQADQIIRTGQADLVLLARAELRDPYWPLRAAQELRQQPPVPPQYARAW